MLQDSVNSWKAFSASCWLWKSFLQKSRRGAWRSGSWLVRDQVNVVDEANVGAQFVQLLKHWLCDMQSDIVLEKHWPFSVDQCWLQAWQFLMQLIDLLSILLRCTGFARTQKDVVDQMGSRPPNSHHDIFEGKFGFGKCFGAFFLQPLAGLCQLSYKILFSWCIKIWSRNGSLLLHRIEKRSLQKKDFFDFHSAHKAPTYWAFHLSSLFQVPDGDRMVDTEFFGNSSCGFKRIGLDDGLNCHCQLQMAGHYTPHLQVSCLLCKKSLITTALYIH